MPMYEFICEECKNEQELICKVADANTVACPKCGHVPMKRRTSLSAFQLKGGGWYKDGYTKEKVPAKPKPKSTT